VILSLAIALVQPDISIRNLKADGAFGTSAKVTLKRTILEDGSVEWSEKTLWNKKTTWLDVRHYSKTGQILTWTYDWKDDLGKGKSEDSSWAFSTEKDFLKVTQIRYKGAASGASLLTKKVATAYNNPSALWWGGITPSVGDVANTLLFVPSWDVGTLAAVRVAYEADDTLMVGGVATKTHRVALKSAVRNETWWLDDGGMPVKRVFWDTDEDRPNRVDLIEK